MVTFLLVYLLIGLVLNVIGPLASQLRNELKEMRRKCVPVDEVEDRRKKLLAAEIVFRSLTLIFYPVAYSLWFIDLFRRMKDRKPAKERLEKVREGIQKEREKWKMAVIENRSFIYFRDTRGEGMINCPGCGFREEIVISAHGYDEPAPFTRGYQCQKCGKFHRVQFLGGKVTRPYLRCSCGGELSNTHPLFCPRCKARDVYYACECVS